VGDRFSECFPTPRSNKLVAGVPPGCRWAGTVEEDALTAAGVSQGLIRVAASLEDTDDLVADVLNALDRSSP
jgi:cystathionine beta-lyase/cystathionine gamma-synthase